MSTPVKGKPEGPLGLSASEAKVLLLGILCIGEGFKVDFDKLASRGGWTAGSAATMFGNAKRKLFKLNPDDGAENGNGSFAADGEASSSKAATATPRKTPIKRKKATVAAEDDTAPGEEAATPTKPKRQRKTPVKKNAAIKAEAASVGNGNGTPSKIKPEAIDAGGIIKGENRENHDPEYQTKPEHDDVMDDMELDAQLEAMDHPQQSIKAEDFAA
ncbi:putative histone h1.3 [Aspergillus clavatus NRRL 1]|uniref:Histone h1.3., putative n=1 Tax=Aspergillus clavatus (strain ATCC 1007 / CBS 513.65 / DSM 816 / NCTC 3887 / NRRL 1 / QM 1276 / 107) TaxID=344612 RepID=A1CHE2_ASPCL|nr:histone h1.3., putative [Aspergillus clavatus NRRL 1]EAW10297.1 histone h1.3., putative [Aspergillus clavatus NRRL 1]